MSWDMLSDLGIGRERADSVVDFGGGKESVDGVVVAEEDNRPHCQVIDVEWTSYFLWMRISGESVGWWKRDKGWRWYCWF